MNPPRTLPNLFMAFIAGLLVFCIVAPSAIWGAAIWGSEQALGANSHEVAYPVVAIDGQQAVAVWVENNPADTYTRVYSRYSTDAGESWSAALTIDTDTGAWASAYDPPCVTIEGDHVIAVWQQQEAGYKESIFANYSSDGGATWQDNAILIQDGNNGECYAVQIAMDGQYAVSIWQQFDVPTSNSISHVCVSSSSDYGVNWSPSKAIEDEAPSESNYIIYARVAINGPHVAAVWNKYITGGLSCVYSNYSSDYGVSWDTSKVVQHGDSDSFDINLAFSGDNLVLTWINGSWLNPYTLLSRYSSDYGASWESIQVIDTTEGVSSPRVVMDGDNAVLVWTHYDDSAPIFTMYRCYSSNGGASWSSPKTICDDSWGYDTKLSMSGSNVVAVWVDSQRIYSNFSGDGGIKWDSSQVIQDMDIDSTSPSLAVSESGAIAVWQQYHGTQVFSNRAYFGKVRRPGVVGGEVEGVNKLPILAPWLVLSGAILIGGLALFFVRRKTA